MSPKPTLDDGRQALADHVLARGMALREAYGPAIDYPTLLRSLEDRDHVRFPTRVVFDTGGVDLGLFAVVDLEGDRPEDGYIVSVHGHFESRLEQVPPLVLYHLVTVNYGDFATAADAEIFGSAALGMDRDAYYDRLCRLADEIPAG